MKSLPLIALCLGLSGCISFPLGQDAKYGRIEIRYYPPPSFYALVDAPAGLGLDAFKGVLR